MAEEYIVGDFCADVALFDASGLPAVIFEVKGHSTPKIDIRLWDVVRRAPGYSRSVPLILAIFEKDEWHFRDVDGSEVDLANLLESLENNHTKPSNLSFYLVGTVFCFIAMIGLITPLFNLKIAPLSREIVSMFFASGVCFILPGILPYIKEVKWKGEYITFVHKTQ